MKKLLKTIIFFLIVFFLTRSILPYLSQLPTILTSLSPEFIVISCLFYLGYFFFRAISWHYILQIFKIHLSLTENIGIWFTGEMARYVPGNIWSILGRVVLLKNKNVAKSVSLVAITLEMILMVFVSFVLSLPVLSAGLNNFSFTTTVAGILLILCLAVFFALRRVKKNARLQKIIAIGPSLFSSSNFWFAVCCQFIAWIFFGLGSLLLAVNLTGNYSDLPIFFSIAIFAWLVGFLSFVTPMGLGVREGVLITLFAPQIGLAKATILAILSRACLIFVEIVNILFWLSKKQREKATQLLKKYFQNKELIVLSLMITIYIVCFSILALIRHQAFTTNFDLGNMDQTIWNTLNGRFFSLSTSAGTLSRLAIHADFILILLSPIYLIWNDVRMLLITQTVFLGLGAVPVFLLARKVLRDKFWPLLTSALYLLYPSLQWINLYDFHPVSLAIPFLLFSFYFAYTKNWQWYAFFVLLAVLTKEEISLVVSMMGVLIFFLMKEKKAGSLSFLVGLIWFPLMVFIVIPRFGPTGQHWAFDEWFKGPKDQVAQNGVFSSLSLLLNFVSQKAFSYYWELLRPLVFLPLLGLPFLLLTLPDLSINLLSSFPQMSSARLHYDSGLLPGMLIALIFGLKNLKHFFQRYTPKKYQIWAVNKRYFLTTVFLLICFWISLISGPLPFSPNCWCRVYQVGVEEKEFAKIISQIPQDARVAASGEIRPHLTHREVAFNLPAIPQAVDYIALINQERYAGNYAPRQFEIDLIQKLELDQNFVRIYPSYNNLPPEPISQNGTIINSDKLSTRGHFYLYKNKNSVKNL